MRPRSTRRQRLAKANGGLRHFLRERLNIPAQYGDSECWPWNGAPRVNVGGRAQSVLRFVWTTATGIAPRRPLATICGTRCVQPLHVIDRRPRAITAELRWRVRYLCKTKGWAAPDLARRYHLALADVVAALAGAAR